ncbi:MAG: diguanylate cyclase [Myxococcota bacterium]
MSAREFKGVLSSDEFLEVAETLSTTGYWAFDLEKQVVSWSANVYGLYDYAPFSFEPTYEIATGAFEGHHRETFEAAVMNAATTGESYDLVISMRTHLGTERVVNAIGKARRAKDDRIVGLFGLIRDVTQRVKDRQHLERLGAVVSTMREGVVITDAEGRINWVNDAFTRLTGYTLEESRGQSPGRLLQGPGTDEEAVARMHQQVREGKPFVEEILNYSKYGDPYWLKLSVVPRRDEEGNVVEFFALEVDITEQRQIQAKLERQRADFELVNFKMGKQRRELQRLSDEQEETLKALQAEIARREELEAELRRLATTDELCGIPNRRKLLVRGEKEIRRSRRYDRALSLVCFDIDRFKAVNDDFGHEAGDQVLKAVARATSGALREEIDTVARIGGEEFAILLPEATANDALTVAERIRSVISNASRQIPGPAGERGVTVSLGVAELNESDEAISDVLRRADEALYRAKRSGRDCVRVATDAAAEDAVA